MKNERNVVLARDTMVLVSSGLSLMVFASFISRKRIKLWTIVSLATIIRQRRLVAKTCADDERESLYSSYDDEGIWVSYKSRQKG